jgi:hypothetical protein
MLTSVDVPDDSRLRIVAVHIREARLKEGPSPLSFRVKYGIQGESVSCDTMQVHSQCVSRVSDKKKRFTLRLPEAGARAEADDTFASSSRAVFTTGATGMFLENRQQHQLVRLSMMQQRAYGKLCTAKTHFRLPEISDGNTVEIDKLPLHRTSWNPLHDDNLLDVIGEVDVAVSLHIAAKGSLQNCVQALDITAQEDSLLVNPFKAPLVCGNVVEARSDDPLSPATRESDARAAFMIVEGRPLTPAVVH